MDSNKKHWVFTRTDHYGSKGSEKTKWIFVGTAEEAKEEYDGLIDRNFSPFTTFDYWEDK